MSDPSKITPEHIRQAAANLTRAPQPVRKQPLSLSEVCALLVFFAASNALWSGFGIAMYAGWDYAAVVLSALATASSGLGIGYFAVALYQGRKQ